MACTQFVIIDDSLPADKLIEMENKLEALDGVTSLLAYNSIVGAAIPDTIIPDDIMSLCKQDGKAAYDDEIPSTALLPMS